MANARENPDAKCHTLEDTGLANYFLSIDETTER